VIVTGIPHRGRPGHPRFMSEMSTVMMEVAGVRRSGSAALDLAYVAAGRYDGYWERGLKAWDIAAGTVLVREAGGMVLDVDGGDTALTRGDVLAGNSAITKALLPLLAH
jgi:myo-inositol-1(or 4)-monophosphatase